MWHHAIIAETLPAADSPERLAELQHFPAAMRQAQDALIMYYGLPVAGTYQSVKPVLYRWRQLLP